MREAASTALAVAALVLILMGVNEANPYQGICLIGALILGAASHLIRKHT